ncbi:hypothetical protein NDU88_003343 [Pleurodeles waltl]|uniref:Uncharacterized protein n=1 Tax=Pleurodeles waltl TaxID=8319 RepID=A0AAV7M424_PLEWA|nr:hypothetical protein NDU88_003343 [Pleurodeles waltl]
MEPGGPRARVSSTWHWPLRPRRSWGPNVREEKELRPGGTSRPLSPGSRESSPGGHRNGNQQHRADPGGAEGLRTVASRRPGGESGPGLVVLMSGGGPAES